MPNAAENLATETVVLLPVGQCHKSPSQPRRRGDKKPDDDFVASIRAKGVIQPIVVRKRKAGGWEIVFGHRRHTGSVIAECETIPAIVREMTDEEVFEAQLIENVHREDMHPLDEADGFKRMMDGGQGAAQIAGKIGRPLTYVAQRLKLCDLGKEARAALDKDRISLGVAILLARVFAALQPEAFKSLWEGMGVDQAKRRLEETYLLRLDQAPFAIADAMLVPKAGACTVCPKRTGQQRELFPDAARADMCTDPVCYRGKLDAVWTIRKKAATESGQAVLEGQAANRAAGYGSGYKKLNEDEWYDGKHRKVRSLFGKDLPPITLARDDKTGAIHELVKSTDVDKALKRKPQPSFGRGAAEKRADEKDRIRSKTVALALAQAVNNVKRLKAPQLLRVVVGALVDRTWNDDQMVIIRRRELTPAQGEGKKRGYGVGAEELLQRHLKAMTKPDDVAGLGLELALLWLAPGRNQPAGPAWRTTLGALGVNYDALERIVTAEAKAKKDAKKSKGKKK
jgi:ParB/RepB/Spo0J family partition protein